MVYCNSSYVSICTWTYLLDSFSADQSFLSAWIATAAVTPGYQHATIPSSSIDTVDTIDLVCPYALIDTDAKTYNRPNVNEIYFPWR